MIVLVLLWLPLGVCSLCIGYAILARIDDAGELRRGDDLLLSAWIGLS